MATTSIRLAMDDLTWAALLARWTEFAQSSLALPPDAEGDAWRTSIAPIISLQAITHALEEIEHIDPDERARQLAERRAAYLRRLPERS